VQRQRASLAIRGTGCVVQPGGPDHRHSRWRPFPQDSSAGIAGNASLSAVAGTRGLLDDFLERWALRATPLPTSLGWRLIPSSLRGPFRRPRLEERNFRAILPICPRPRRA
jgi:hypothetical protein